MIEKNVTRRSFAGAMGLGAIAALAGCSGSGKPKTSATAASGDVKIEMVADTGGVHDQSFNQLAYTGLQQLEAENGWEISVLESKQESDYATNLDKAADDDCTLVWGVGYSMSEAINNVAEQNPDKIFAVIDCGNEMNLDNLTGVFFAAEESSFVVGYIAARMSQSGKVGFVGGMKSELIQLFEYGYAAGVEYANKAHNLKVSTQSQYAESFSDSAKGKSIAQKMIQDGCDVLFHAAGGTGIGMLDACMEANVKSIGVDQDQSLIRPEDKSIITSALKRVDIAVINITKGLIDGSIEGGQNVTMGIAEGAVGIPENIVHEGETEPRVPEDIYNDAINVFDQIKAGEITVPKNEESFNEFVKGL